MRSFNLRALLAFGLALTIAGCGGGGGATGGTQSGGSDGGGGTTPSATLDTRIHVDVTTGKVTVVAGQAQSRAVFAGSSIGYNSSVLLDTPGSDTGLKSINVSLTNNWGLAVGATPDGTATGLRVLFGSFVNAGTPPVISGLTNVSSLAGSGVKGTSDGPTLGATFFAPGGVVAGGNGTFYVADTGNQLIRKIANGQVSTLAGGGVAGADGAGKGAGFSAPYGLAFNPLDGAIIVTENSGNRVRRMTPNGSVSTIAGTGVVGATNGSGTSATFSKPSGVAVDSSGIIYVCDANNRQVRRIVFLGGDPTSASNYQVSTFSGSGASGSADGSSGTATFTSPAGIAFDSSASAFYVADSGGNRVRRLDSAGSVTTVAGTGATSETDGPGSSATLKGPVGVAVRNGVLIVSTSSGCDIRQLSLTTGAAPTSAASWTVQTLAGVGSAGASDGVGTTASFSSPQLIGLDASGDVLIPDSSNNKVRMLTPTNGSFPVGTPGGSPPAELVRLSNPTGLIPVPGTGVQMPYIAYPGSLAPSTSSPAQPWNFIIPNGVNSFDFTVSVEADTPILSTPTGSGGVGSSSVTVRTVAGGLAAGLVDGPGTEAEFDGLYQLAVDRAGVMYVADNQNDALRRITPDGHATTIAGVIGTTPGSLDGPGNTASLSSPKGIAVSPDGTAVYFTDGQRIRVASIFAGADATLASNWNVSTIAGGSSAGNLDGRGTAAQFNSPWALALASSGNLYVAEFGGNRVRRMQPLGGSISSASNWQTTVLAGDPGAGSGDLDSFGVVARFSGPEGIAVDAGGNLFVAEAANHRIRKISTAGQVTTIAGGVSNDTPSSGYTDATGSAARFNVPTSVAVDSAGYVYVGDFNNEVIRRISPGGVVTTVAGVHGFAGRTDGAGNVATFGGIRGLAVTASGNILVADNTNCLIREVQRTVASGTQ